MSIFLLCFCSAEKAAAVCGQLIELKELVIDHDGLLGACLKGLGLNQDERIKEYAKKIGTKYVDALSVNMAQVNSSLYLI